MGTARFRSTISQGNAHHEEDVAGGDDDRRKPKEQVGESRVLKSTHPSGHCKEHDHGSHRHNDPGNPQSLRSHHGEQGRALAEKPVDKPAESPDLLERADGGIHGQGHPARIAEMRLRCDDPQATRAVRNALNGLSRVVWHWLSRRGGQEARPDLTNGAEPARPRRWSILSPSVAS